MKKILLLLFSIQSILCFAGGDVHSHSNRNEKNFYKSGRLPDLYYQQELRESAAWQNFLKRNGDWWVLFNEENQKPHRAFGKPIHTNGHSPVQKVKNFIAGELADFRIPLNDLIHLGSSSTEKYTYVNFYQTYMGLRVLESRFTAKLTPQGKIAMFGADVYSDISINTIATMSQATALNNAAQLHDETVTSSWIENQTAILPIPENKENKFHLVYIVWVETLDDENIPAKYYTLVDAHNGNILYRQNMVQHAIDVNMKGQLYNTHNLNPATTENLVYLEHTIGTNTYYTNSQGNSSIPLTGPQSATFYLRGLWSTVRTNNVTPQFTVSLNTGANNLSFNSNSNIRERSAYYHVNIIHDHMKFYLPTFTLMDISLTTNVDVTGSCNAFYNGSSINFYAQGGGCTSYATTGDVVYHEYGHGINDKFYQANSAMFTNGAMNEGYADFWAYSITNNAILGLGTSLTDPNAYIRRYDINRKVYPVNLVGQVHADGEIIAGAWWDTYLNFGSNMNQTILLFVEAYNGLQAFTANGNEGQAYTDVLIDALMADDNDADLTNGTPNGQAIADAFALHGITLISNASLNHTALVAANQNTGININATLTLTFPYTNYLSAVKCFYKINRNGAWNNIVMTNVSGNNYTATIPGQPEGTVISYYLGAEDLNGMLTAVQPKGAHQPDPNIPYFILVGYTSIGKNDAGDSVSPFGNFTVGLPSDNATTGQWINDIPIGSFSTPGDLSTMVQPNYQVTPGGDYCFVTGNAASETSPLGEADVDGGTTTLLSPVFDMTNYTNPTFTYFRWYTNNPPSGANPNADWWQVFITNDGVNWVPVEETKTSDRSWRRFAFRVVDYVSLTNQIQLKFNVSDSIRTGEYLNGGSLVEAALDEIELWDNASNNNINELSLNFIFYPNPAHDIIYLSSSVTIENAIITICDVSGRMVKSISLNTLLQNTVNMIHVHDLSAGTYQITVKGDKKSLTKKFVIAK